MHFFSLFTFATIVLSAVFALPVSNPKCVTLYLLFRTANGVLSASGIMARDGPASSREIEVLETRGKGSQHKGKKKHVSPAPRSDPHGDSQKQVEEHRKLLKELSVSRGTAADGVVQ